MQIDRREFLIGLSAALGAACANYRSPAERRDVESREALISTSEIAIVFYVN